MAKRNQSPRKAAMRKLMGDFLKENDISLKDGGDINALMRERMSAVIEEALDKQIYLETHTNLAAAIHIYEKSGYREIEIAVLYSPSSWFGSPLPRTAI